ncbi:hypothetical protein SAMN05444339_10275 [Loktanella atrilutea]|uniref:IraD/Gp25-like domain-containing protein n=1 Tax=Loktanella atrilutea TaxID=366533 RepID=A0A1M4WDA9_LOKAT|nr:GPW/gp25 family protein [Loktanella atrilutea]SHE79204.1 hypothetical protein SAMN05444339_10275 [Loktanella atrilutea]
MDRETGAVLTGWPAVLQSIGVILTTPIGSRVMRREFGSVLPELVDRPLNSSTILAIYAASADAIARWEPRFTMNGAEVAGVNAQGRIWLIIRGTYDGNPVSGEVAL